MSQTFQLPKSLRRDGQIERIAAFLSRLAPEKGWVVEVKEKKRKRSDPQNRYLWGVCYPAILKHLEGWEAEDVHEYCLGECFGWDRLTGLNRDKARPLKRSSTLTVVEFMNYVDWIQRHMAEKGIYVPDPNEEAT